MRAPRYKFPDEVRTATRLMATRMVREENIARSPDELERWIDAHPDTKQPLEKGGYGKEFDSYELLPLLEAFLVRAGAPAPAPEPADPEGSGRWIWVAAVVFFAVVAGILVIALGAV